MFFFFSMLVNEVFFVTHDWIWLNFMQESGMLRVWGRFTSQQYIRTVHTFTHPFILSANIEACYLLVLAVFIRDTIWTQV